MLRFKYSKRLCGQNYICRGLHYQHMSGKRSSILVSNIYRTSSQPGQSMSKSHCVLCATLTLPGNSRRKRNPGGGVGQGASIPKRLKYQVLFFLQLKPNLEARQRLPHVLTHTWWDCSLGNQAKPSLSSQNEKKNPNIPTPARSF